MNDELRSAMAEELGIDDKKIFCRNCRYYSNGEWGDCCEHPRFMEDTYYGPARRFYGKPDVENKDNDCPHFEPKAPFGERIENWLRKYKIIK